MNRSPNYSDCERIPLRSRSSAPRRRSEIEFEARVKEDERRRIAQDLHDDLGGVLFGMKSCIHIARNRAARDGVRADPVLDDAAALATAAFDTLRRIAIGLRCGADGQAGLWQSLRDAVGALARRSTIVCEHRIDAECAELALGAAREQVILRVVQEALTNIERHAKASRAALRVSSRAGMLEVLIEDDGIGMADCAPTRGSGMGLPGFQARAAAVDAVATVWSAPGAGTIVRLELPLEH